LIPPSQRLTHGGEEAPPLAWSKKLGQDDSMKKFFAPNIGRAGRLLRAAFAFALFIGSFFLFARWSWISVLLAFLGAFVLIEALSGWCVMRACGFKTKC
jgi:hypothetical protein